MPMLTEEGRQRPARRHQSDARRFPDFFIVGAPRCGTTFMYEYLRQHPDIFMPDTKEPNHFCTDLDSGSYLDSLSFLRDLDSYLALFQPALPNQSIGEASTWYLYSKAAAQNIARANPLARAIIMLRDPVEMLYSLHGRRLYGGSEDLARFEDALDAEEDRKQGRRIPPRARNVTALYYRDVGRYADQVQRYIDALGRERVHIIIFEEFRANPAEAYRDTVAFLGADPAFTPDFRVVNESAGRRSWRLQQVLLSPKAIRAARLMLPPRVRPIVGRFWDSVNSRQERRPPLEPATSARLREELLPDIVHLGEILGRDLTRMWRSGDTGAARAH
jgi:hypothetical protein